MGKGMGHRCECGSVGILSNEAELTPGGLVHPNYLRKKLCMSAFG